MLYYQQEQAYMLIVRNIREVLTMAVSIANELCGLTEDNVVQLFQYAKFLKQNNPVEGTYTVYVSNGVKKSPKRQIGALKEGFVSIASDFDDTLTGLEDYV